jgi:hypothetical protein
MEKLTNPGAETAISAQIISSGIMADLISSANSMGGFPADLDVAKAAFVE